MKSPAGRTRPAPKRVRLDLRRAAPPPPPEDEMLNRRTSNFWLWFGVVALFHIVLLVLVMIYYRPTASPPPPTPFFSLVPQGDTVKGTLGAQAAPKLGASTPAAVHHHHPKPITPPQPVTPPPPPPPTAIQPPPEKIQPKPIVHEDNAPAIAEAKPKPKPAPPKPKIKVSLQLADGPVPDKPPIKPKRAKKTPPPVAEDRSDNNDQDTASTETTGLSKEQIAQKLGKKLEAEGVTHATNLGTSGVANGHDNPFGEFYNSIREQITNKWQEPNQNDPQATDPIVQIHVEKDGRVPVESVTLLKSSGNQAIDDSALSAARALGYTLQPLPDGCPPDISISLKLTN